MKQEDTRGKQIEGEHFPNKLLLNFLLVSISIVTMRSRYLKLADFLRPNYIWVIIIIMHIVVVSKHGHIFRYKQYKHTVR